MLVGNDDLTKKNFCWNKYILFKLQVDAFSIFHALPLKSPSNPGFSETETCLYHYGMRVKFNNRRQTYSGWASLINILVGHVTKNCDKRLSANPPFSPASQNSQYCSSIIPFLLPLLLLPSLHFSSLPLSISSLCLLFSATLSYSGWAAQTGALTRPWTNETWSAAYFESLLIDCNYKF